jgi:hypothetical protein
MVVPAPPHGRGDPRFHPQARDVVRFFRTTWIPDETFFQTLVRHLVPDREIESRSLTFKMFSDYGMPVTFYNDQYDLLLSQDYLFARKISPEARVLEEAAGRALASPRTDFTVSQEGPKLYEFLTGRGRSGGASARGSGNAKARSAPTGTC